MSRLPQGLPARIDAEIAADGIDEYLDVFVRTRGKQPLRGALRLSTTDTDRSWLLAPAAKPGRVDINPAAAGVAVAELSGSSEALLLHVWRRRTLDQADLQISGESDIARSLTEG